MPHPHQTAATDERGYPLLVPREPHRLTPTERLHEVTMAAMQRAASPPEHLCEVTRNSKGVHQYTMAIRGYDWRQVLADALEARATLDAELPYPAENGTA